MPEVEFETREIKDAEGNVRVTIKMPVGTSEEDWAKEIAAYDIIEDGEDAQ